MMDIVLASWIETMVKWVLVALALGVLGWALMWGVGEWQKPCPDCLGTPVRCEACGGSGNRVVTETCPKCKGSGEGRIYGKCSECNGNRTISYEVTCEECKGYKTIECPKCHKRLY